MSTRLLALPLALCVLALGPATAEAKSRVSGDFNGDGHDDLAVGVPSEDVGSIEDAGAVNVLYGSGVRLRATDNQLWHQDSTGIADTAEVEDRFGWSVAAGDFNGDGFDDLAVGVPDEDVGSIAQAGAVNALYGSRVGLRATDNQLWHQNRDAIVDTVETDDRFGWSVAAGDFNGNGKDDLAVGVPDEDVGSIGDAGAVNAVYGSGIGLRATDNQFWHQDSTGIADMAEANDHFGRALAAGDFNGNGHDDLAVGVPWEDTSRREVRDGGTVNVIYGSRIGLRATDNQLWHLDNTQSRIDPTRAGDNFGWSLAAGDFDGNGHDDLAVGVAGRDLSTIVEDNGAVIVIYGSGVRLRAGDVQSWFQGGLEIADAAETGDGFGSSLTAGDFNGNGHDDLAVGVPGEDVGSIQDAGAVNVIYGSEVRLRATDNQFWHQDSTGIADAAEVGDIFGRSLTAGDFDGSGHDDLAVGVPFEDLGGGSIQRAGAVNAFYGSGVRLGATDDQFWHQDSTGIADTAEVADEFGFSLPN